MLIDELFTLFVAKLPFCAGFTFWLRVWLLPVENMNYIVLNYPIWGWFTVDCLVLVLNCWFIFCVAGDFEPRFEFVENRFCIVLKSFTSVNIYFCTLDEVGPIFMLLVWTDYGYELKKSTSLESTTIVGFCIFPVFKFIVANICCIVLNY